MVKKNELPNVSITKKRIDPTKKKSPDLGEIGENKSLFMGKYLFVDWGLFGFNLLATLLYFYTMSIHIGNVELVMADFHAWGMVYSLSFMYVVFHIIYVVYIDTRKKLGVAA